MEQHIYYILFIMKGASKKVLQFLMLMQPIYNKNDHSNKQDVYYGHCRGLNNKKSFK